MEYKEILEQLSEIQALMEEADKGSSPTKEK